MIHRAGFSVGEFMSSPKLSNAGTATTDKTLLNRACSPRVQRLTVKGASEVNSMEPLMHPARMKYRCVEYSVHQYRRRRLEMVSVGWRRLDCGPSTPFS
jgi:hypothetical protein